ncbi:protein of unknown function DUF541 [Desulfurispirillum indicum S5]|uniref:DUF541 domain-containing protein n=1 Tax=Desulfurispirillum indicum (strain ATCC BAA-1389 / DSM 22839 / S5) TaxID=653733 RepID=E6W6G8_DESIS|nr:SIMPL domain-containing protein [Desulfurispirillum indicum]ADU67303.1 protein of unknown function DUF541 [Desulfurispirillum indicum S5]
MKYPMLFLLVTLLCLVPAVLAGEFPENMIQFEVSAEGEVENDTITVMLRYQTQSAQPSVAADEVNRTMEWMQRQLGSFADVKSRHRGYRTTPLPQSAEQRGREPIIWQVQQEVELRSTNIVQMQQAIARLQERLAVTSVVFSPSPQLHDRQSDALTRQALQKFRQQAELIRKELGARSYRLGQLHVNSYSQEPPRDMFLQRSSAEVSTMSIAPPAMESGSSRIQVRVGGSIFLDF